MTTYSSIKGEAHQPFEKNSRTWRRTNEYEKTMPRLPNDAKRWQAMPRMPNDGKRCHACQTMARNATHAKHLGRYRVGRKKLSSAGTEKNRDAAELVGNDFSKPKPKKRGSTCDEMRCCSTKPSLMLKLSSGIAAAAASLSLSSSSSSSSSSPRRSVADGVRLSLASASHDFSAPGF